MEYIRNTLQFHVAEDSVITLGKFDGLHRGHELLMNELRKQKKENDLKAIVFTFDIPPRKRVDDAVAKVLTTNDEKHYIFENAGIDYLIECPFTPEVMCMEPEAFIKWMVDALSVKCIVVGSDFGFGYQRSGNYEVLKKFEQKYGYHTIVMSKMQEDGRDISSTFVREEIEKGHIEKANHLLGYPFFVKNKVIHGNQIGRKMGIPTINMAISEEKMIPPFGVYVTSVMIGDQKYKGISNIGRKPTISDDNPIGLETYILDFEDNLYEEDILVEFLKFIRPEQKFSDIETLKFQIEKDIESAYKYYKNITKMC